MELLLGSLAALTVAAVLFTGLVIFFEWSARGASKSKGKGDIDEKRPSAAR